MGLFGDDFELVEMKEEKDSQRGFWHALMRRRQSPERERRSR